jgi:crotonobetainyl-CoA:carnitine CoA-transferase CaiB-like acyl-CoA transferase
MTIESPITRKAVEKLWSGARLPETALDQLDLEDIDPVQPSSFAVGAAAQASIALAGLAAAELHRLRSGKRQRVGVDMHHAAAEFRSERYLRIAGEAPKDPWDPIARLYRTGDDGWVRLHTNFPHHRDGVLRLLKADYDREAVAAALKRWKAEEFETVAAQAGLCVTALRTFKTWDSQPQGQAIAASPVIIEKIGEAPAELLVEGGRPLEGLRVLDLTRIIAGPVGGRTLAAHGADVLLITAQHLPSVATLVVDTGRGKRSGALDLRDAGQRARLEELVRGADVFVQGYRPGGLKERGFGAEELAKLRPGIVAASLSAYGEAGPWRGRRGFDSLVQTASGFNAAEAEAAGDENPRPLPCQALDHASGYFLAFGIMAALIRRATEGGSWRVVVSLAATGKWLRSLGRIDRGFACHDPQFDDVKPFLEETPSDFGPLIAVRHAAQLEATPAYWARPARKLGADRAEWL